MGEFYYAHRDRDGATLTFQMFLNNSQHPSLLAMLAGAAMNQDLASFREPQLPSQSDKSRLWSVQESIGMI